MSQQTPVCYCNVPPTQAPGQTTTNVRVEQLSVHVVDASRPLTTAERQIIVGALDRFIRHYSEQHPIDPPYMAVARSARAKILAGATP